MSERRANSVRRGCHRLAGWALRRGESPDGRKRFGGVNHVRISCGECGMDLGWIEEKHIDSFHRTHCGGCIEDIKGYSNG